MTVPVPGSLTYSYSEDGVTTIFAYPVRFIEAQELVVMRTVDGIATTLTMGVDYTVSGEGNPAGGSITRTAATNGGTITIYRDTTWKQLVDLEDKQRNPAQAVEDQLDRLTMAGQDSYERLGALADKADDLDNAVALANAAANAAEQHKQAAEDAQAAAESAAGANLSNADSRAAAILTNFPGAVHYIRTAGYAAVGDGGGALYKRVLTEPTHAGKFQSADGAWWELAEDMVFVEMFGAKGDGTTDDKAAIQNAINFTRRVFFMPQKNYRVNGQITLPNKQQLHGFGYGAGSANAGGSPKIIFDGTEDACIINQVPSVFIGHGGLYGLSIYATGTYDWILDLKGCIAWHISRCHIETTSTSTGGFRSAKIKSSDPSWLNIIDGGTTIHLPSGSTARPLEHDWSDSRIALSSLSGGIGTLDTGYGTQYFQNNIERSTGYGITLKKLVSIVSSVMIGNYIDANAVAGIAIDVSEDPTSNYSIAHIIQDNQFRTVHPQTGVAGTADIDFINGTENVYSGGVIGGNQHRVSAVPAYSIDLAEWRCISFGPSYHVNSALAMFTLGDDPNFHLDWGGINIPGGPGKSSLIRGTANVYGMGGVALTVGAPATSGTPGVQLGATSAAVPFIAASRTAAGVATDLRFYTDATHRMTLAAAGGLRPAADQGMDLGTSSLRFARAYLNSLILIDGRAEPTTVAGNAQIYIDSVDGDLKIKFGDGTVKTIVTDTP